MLRKNLEITVTKNWTARLQALNAQDNSPHGRFKSFSKTNAQKSHLTKPRDSKCAKATEQPKRQTSLADSGTDNFTENIRENKINLDAKTTK
ncbi:hypothetical protein TNCV_2693271 [Trichonephila clavipes]|nr:hypothetical protein TNCV_4963711 [Trichonephila clavipes]GFU47456.1 hypothetical protein TNCV_2693271 [Trichonephila clavipes]